MLSCIKRTLYTTLLKLVEEELDMIVTVSCYCQDITIHSKTILTRFSPMNFSSCVSSIELSLYTALHYVGKYSCVLGILLSLNVK